MKKLFSVVIKGKTILGIWNIPKMLYRKVIIVCYGLNGNRVIENRLGTLFAEFCERKNVSVVRFDYRNAGISEGEFYESCLYDRVEDTIEICNLIKRSNSLAATKLFLLGISDGARVALLASGKSNCQGLILWNPIFNIYKKGLVKERKPNNSDKFILHPLFKRPIKKLLGTCLNMQILKQIETENAYYYLENFLNDILIIFGQDDVKTKDILEYVEKNCVKNNIHMEIIENADHLFRSEVARNKLFLKTLSWIKREKEGGLRSVIEDANG